METPASTTGTCPNTPAPPASTTPPLAPIGAGNPTTTWSDSAKAFYPPGKPSTHEPIRHQHLARDPGIKVHPCPPHRHRRSTRSGAFLHGRPRRGRQILSPDDHRTRRMGA